MNHRQRITAITTWIAGVIAVAVTLLLPLGYFAVSYQYLSGSLEAEAEMTSHIISELINANPELWEYEQVRLEELLARRTREGHQETRRVFDRHNQLVAESVTALKSPLISRGVKLLDSGTIVGRIEINSSLFPVLLRSGGVALAGFACGLVIFFTLRVLPLRAVEQAEKHLRESEERYRLLVENAPDAILVYDNELLLYANNAALRLFGVERAEQLIGQPLMSIVHPDNRQLIEDGGLLSAHAGVIGSHHELMLAQCDGTPIEVEAVGIHISYQGGPAVQMILHDVTERKRLQDQLRDKLVLLESTLAKMKQLEGIIPICMYCKKIRDDKESWHQLEGYITEHSEAHFSHGICPECYATVSRDSLKELKALKLS